MSTTTSQADKARRFLDVLAVTGDVSKACAAIGIARMTAYRWRDKDATFAAEWDALKVVEPDEAAPAAAPTPAAVRLPALNVDQVEHQPNEAGHAEALLEAQTVAGADAPEEAPIPANVTPSPSAFAEPARYRLTEAAYIGATLHQPDTVVSYDGIPGHHMIPVNDAARAAKGLVTGGAGPDQLDVDDFINEAALRSAAIKTELDVVTGKLLFAKGRQFVGSDTEKAAARAEVGALQQLIVQKNAELALLAPMVEHAQEMVESAGREVRAQQIESARADIDLGLTLRVWQAMQIDAYAILIGQQMRELLSSGEQAWSRVRLCSNENVAWSCTPDPNAVAQALVGALMRSGGLSLDGIAQLSTHGLDTLRSYETVGEIVQRQNDALVARLQ